MVASKTRIKAEANGVAAEKVTLLDVKAKTVIIPIRGTSPYICHNWDAKVEKMIEDKEQKKGKVKGREARKPEDEVDACFYRDDKGRYCIPARAFKKAVVSAATSLDDVRNFPKTKLRQAIFFDGDLLPIIYNTEPEMRRDHVPANKGGPMRYRPEFKDWAVNLVVTFNESVLSLDQVVNIISLAGFAVGVGDWRPEKDGNNGRFEVNRNEVKE